MSPTSYQLLHPAIYVQFFRKDLTFFVKKDLGKEYQGLFLVAGTRLELATFGL